MENKTAASEETKSQKVAAEEEESSALYQTITVQVKEKERKPLYAYCYGVTRAANNLYNAAMYLQRQVFFAVKKEPDKWHDNERAVMESIRMALPIMGPKYSMPALMTWKLSYGFLEAYMRATSNPDFFNDALPKQSAQQTLKEVERAFKSYIGDMREYRKEPGKFTGEPKLPRYRKSGDCHTVMLTNQDCVVEVKEKGTWVTFPKTREALAYAEELRLNDRKRVEEKAKAEQAGLSTSGKEFREPPVRVTRFTGKAPETKKLPIQIGDNLKNRPDLRLKQVTIKPYQGTFRIQFNFQSSDLLPKVAKGPVRACCIDLGVNNLAAISNNIGLSSQLWKGGVLKSVNQYYNKRMAEFMSDQTTGTTNKFKPTDDSRRLSVWRDNRINDFMHKVAKLIVTWCVENSIELIIIGHNQGWKQKIDNGPVNNQKFVQIPFDRLKSMIRYLSARYGIQVVYQEESYTSLASFPDDDFMPVYGQEGDVKPTFSGKRGPTEYNGHKKTQKQDPVTREQKTTNPKFRGLYQPTKKDFGEVINSDLNGSANIGRKYRPDLFEIGQKPDFKHVIIIKHPDDVYCTAKENREKQLKAREGMPPSKSKLRRQRRRERRAAEQKTA